MMKKTLIVALALALFGDFVWYTQTFTPAHYLKRTESKANLQRDIGGITKVEGAEQAVSTVALALDQGLIGVDECHLLLHLIGHTAYQLHGSNWSTLLAMPNAGMCLGGYTHGLEAEVAIAGDRAELFNLCDVLKENKLSNGPCYHGAGHSYFERSRNVQGSLRECDALSKGPESDLTNCYKGVFSELGNQMNGAETNTNTASTPFEDATQGIDPSHPYAVCEQLSPKYADACYSQLAKLFYRSAEKAESIARCLPASPRIEVQKICAAILGGMAARNLIDEGGAEQLPSLIQTAPLTIRDAVIRGVYEGFAGAAYSNVRLPPWREICDALPNTERATCLKL